MSTSEIKAIQMDGKDWFNWVFDSILDNKGLNEQNSTKEEQDKLLKEILEEAKDYTEKMFGILNTDERFKFDVDHMLIVDDDQYRRWVYFPGVCLDSILDKYVR